MADEFVSAAQFGEVVKRIDERFDSAEKLADQRYENLNQRLADAEKAREQNLVHISERFDDMNRSINQRLDDMNRGINQRFDGMEKRMDLFHADMLQMRNWMVRLYGLVAFGFIGAIALILLKDVIFK
ncbi:MAG: hypothetical protein OXP66_08860 [Candidatus Tectomicrobia bacterium]|nr:hypothetical protein [Candidatus Tectomicrobia bacterium]